MANKTQIESKSIFNFEQCLKCSICTVYCPVAAVNPAYPGPKQAGPDGERYRLKSPVFFDESLKKCLNCKRCEVACPSNVNVGDIIQAARMQYSQHKPGLRDRILASTDFVGTMANRFAPIVNTTLAWGLTKSLMHGTIGVDKHRTFPAYTNQRFETWFKRNAQASQDQYSKHVSYFHGCYVNYNFPKLGQDFVKIMNAVGYGVHLLEKERCCGVAKIANGLYDQARKHANININSIKKSVQDEGRPVLTTSSTCTFTLRDEYDHLLGDPLPLPAGGPGQGEAGLQARLQAAHRLPQRLPHGAHGLDRIQHRAAEDGARHRLCHAREHVLRHCRHLWIQEGELRDVAADRRSAL